MWPITLHHVSTVLRNLNFLCKFGTNCTVYILYKKEQFPSAISGVATRTQCVRGVCHRVSVYEGTREGPFNCLQVRNVLYCIAPWVPHNLAAPQTDTYIQKTTNLSKKKCKMSLNEFTNIRTVLKLIITTDNK